mmetsp:Transcript_72742/g.100849  ORF Transcript_72742/g.100849 Transcript_72742/m.100849 type:complete len:91 (+) Transcript_72742:137-409(+)
MKTAFATLVLAAVAGNSDTTEVALLNCTDNTATSTSGCLHATYHTIDDNSELSWQWMLKAQTMTNSSYSSLKTGYAYCSYLSIPFGDMTM